MKYDFKNQKPTVKHDGPIVRTEDTIDRFIYKDILANHMPPFTETNLEYLTKYRSKIHIQTYEYKYECTFIYVIFVYVQ